MLIRSVALLIGCSLIAAMPGVASAKHRSGGKHDGSKRHGHGKKRHGGGDGGCLGKGGMGGTNTSHDDFDNC